MLRLVYGNLVNFKQLLVTASLLLATVSSFAYDFEVDGIYYNVISLSDLTCEVTFRNDHFDDYSGEVKIPSTVRYNGRNLKVVSIGKKAFAYCTMLGSVTIPDGVVSIGELAFQGNVISLRSIAIGKDIASIGANAFFRLRSIESSLYKRHKIVV